MYLSSGRNATPLRPPMPDWRFLWAEQPSILYDGFMEILSSLGLLVLILVAFSLMAGGRAANVLRPATRLANNLLALVVRFVLSIFGGLLKLGGRTIRLPKTGPLPKDDNRGPGPPPPRWE
jgi:hypothetical protein